MSNEYVEIYKKNKFDQNEMNKIDVLVEKSVNKYENDRSVAQNYLDTIFDCLKNHHDLGDLEVQEMIDKSFHFAEQISHHSKEIVKQIVDEERESA